jgi:hypothetical protein
MALTLRRQCKQRHSCQAERQRRQRNPLIPHGLIASALETRPHYFLQDLVQSQPSLKRCRSQALPAFMAFIRPIAAGCTVHTTVALDTNVLRAKLSVVDSQNTPFRPVSDMPSLPCSDGISCYSASSTTDSGTKACNAGSPIPAASSYCPTLPSSAAMPTAPGWARFTCPLRNMFLRRPEGHGNHGESSLHRGLGRRIAFASGAPRCRWHKLALLGWEWRLSKLPSQKWAGFFASRPSAILG